MANQHENFTNPERYQRLVRKLI